MFVSTLVVYVDCFSFRSDSRKDLGKERTGFSPQIVENLTPKEGTKLLCVVSLMFSRNSGIKPC